MEYIDITNAGTYDFLYLRIDFQNRCKYFLVSFFANWVCAVSAMRSSTLSILNPSSPSRKPASEPNGLKPAPSRFWKGEQVLIGRNRFHSDKICDISYANIQGKESLIEKFRNSCVMDEDPSYRPKIFHSSGPLMGQEQEFPEPNNTRRKLRSIACARQIGLFPHLTLLSPFSNLSRFLETFLPADWYVDDSWAGF